jgi:hypothetical protein
VSAVRSWWLACSEKPRSARSSSSTRCALRSSDDAIASISGTPLRRREREVAVAQAVAEREPGQRVGEPLALDQCEPGRRHWSGDAEEDEGEQARCARRRCRRVNRTHEDPSGPGAVAARGRRSGAVLDDLAVLILDQDPVACPTC